MSGSRFWRVMPLLATAAVGQVLELMTLSV